MYAIRSYYALIQLRADSLMETSEACPVISWFKQGQHAANGAVIGFIRAGGLGQHIGALDNAGDCRCRILHIKIGVELEVFLALCNHLAQPLPQPVKGLVNRTMQVGVSYNFV